MRKRRTNFILCLLLTTAIFGGMSGCFESTADEDYHPGIGVPRLSLSATDTVVYIGGTGDDIITVTNRGNAMALGMTALPLTSPFSYKGGTYPGTGGSCSTTLNFGASCTIRVTYSATDSTISSSTLVLSYYADVTQHAKSATYTLQKSGASGEAGTVDVETFGSSGHVMTPVGSSSSYGAAIAIQSDGKMVVAGIAYNAGGSDFGVARYNTDGSLDTTFNGTGKVVTDLGTTGDEATAVAIQSDGKIVVVGITNASLYDFAVVRYNTDGTLDTGFDGDGIAIIAVGTAVDFPTCVAVQSNGRIVVGGFILVAGQGYNFSLIRLLTNGALDNSFDFDGKLGTDLGWNDFGNALAIQSDGKILLAGETSGVDNDFGIVRYNTDGSLDNSFSGDGIATYDFGGGADDTVNAVAIQSDGNIVLAGTTTVGSDQDFALVRFTSTGLLDTSFSYDGAVSTSLGTNSAVVRGLALQPDGKIVAVGYLNIGSAGFFAAARYDTDGILDTEFSGDGVMTAALPGSTISAATGVVLQSDGKIVLVGVANSQFALIRIWP